MSKRYKQLPCGLKIRIDANLLYLLGNWGASYSSSIVKPNKAVLDIVDDFENLQAISDFFAAEAKKRRSEEAVEE